jgi:hypothetical protein
MSDVPKVPVIKPVLPLGNIPALPAPEPKKKSEGWAFLWNSKKWHYFRDGRSLCGRWMCFSYDVDEKEKIDSPDNCAACKRKRLKELEKAK